MNSSFPETALTDPAVCAVPSARSLARIKVCLAASGWGHLRQMLDIQPIWRNLDYFIVTEDTALGRSFAAEHRSCFVPHFALGQAKLGHPFLMFSRALRNCWISFRTIARERPELLITTGAGSTFFVLVWARLFGAKIILLDSMARVKAPSKFARIAGWAADLCISQSVRSAQAWGRAIGFETVRRVGPFKGKKEPLVFATVGATLPFDRLTGMVSQARKDGHIPEELILQIGDADAVEGDFRCVRSLQFQEVNDILRRASVVICHGGTGSLVTALKAGCHVIAVPRRHDLGEHYDNHQTEITEAFQELGVLRVVHTPEELAKALEEVRSKPGEVIERDMRNVIKCMDGAIARWFAGRT